jgi:hypothetical protein
MHSGLKRSLILALVLTGTFAAATVANPYTPRQYYGGWQKHAKYNYHYRTYYYKPTPTYSGYKHQYVMYSPAKPKHYYYYNPYKKVYWGRCPVDTNGKGLYSALKEEDCKGSIEEIPETAFPEPGKLPAVPEATDDATLELPPDDLPGVERTPK